MESAVLMHGTSPERLYIARLLAKLMHDTGATGAAFGWPVGLADHVLAPVHVVTARPSVTFDARLMGTHVALVEQREGGARLMLHGADGRRLARCARTISFVTGFLALEQRADVPAPPGRSCRFIEFLQAFQAVGFSVDREDVAMIVKRQMEECLRELPAPARSHARGVIHALRRPADLSPALLRLGQTLDVCAEPEHALGVLMVGYELALAHVDLFAGIEFARAAGRGYRKLTAWDESQRWYELACRLAEHAELPGRAALALDGLGNTCRQRGAVPDARRMYRSAWTLAIASGDQEAIGNVAQNLLRVERELGFLEDATRFALVALRAQSDRELRARLLVEVGTLMVDRDDLVAAADAYRAARQLTSDIDIRALALDALLYIRALEGDWRAYDRERPVARAATRTASPYIRVQAGFYRSRALILRGWRDQARRVLLTTERYAAARSMQQYAVQAGELRDQLEAELPPRREMPLPDAVRQELRQLALA